MSPHKRFLVANPARTGRHRAAPRPGRRAGEPGTPARRDRGCWPFGSRAGQAGRSRPRTGRRRVQGKLIGVALAAALPTVTTVTLPGASASTGRPVVWLAANSSVGNLANISPDLAADDLGVRGTMIQNSAPLTENPVKDGYHSLPTERWTSEARFAADVKAGRIPSYVRVAHYDNEKWGATPLVEQRHPARYEERFCHLAHAHGLLCVTGPGRDMCPVAYPNSGTNNECYLRHDLAGSAARYADFVDIQGQRNELRGASAYAAFIRAAAAQARRANPDVVVLGNLDATVGGHSVSALRLNGCARAVFGAGRHEVAGFYITITSAGAATTARFLRLFEP